MKRSEAACHEAGHAVIAWAMGCKVRVARIKAEGGGECECADPAEEEGKFILCFAGPAAQRKHGPVESWHGGGDYARAVEIAQRFGITDERATQLIQKAHELVAEHWRNVERVAVALIERGSLDAAEIESLLGPTPDRLKLDDPQRRVIIEWAKGIRLVEEVRLFGSRSKGFARSKSDVDLALTASLGNYIRFANEWEQELSKALGLTVKLAQYNAEKGIVRGYCDAHCVKLFDRPPDAGARASKP